uniref:Uncharacterized protein n=1 Tax=Glossina pallidipes TaxID=7398 RepID=A0A1B0A098_GLOPL
MFISARNSFRLRIFLDIKTAVIVSRKGMEGKEGNKIIMFGERIIQHIVNSLVSILEHLEINFLDLMTMFIIIIIITLISHGDGDGYGDGDGDGDGDGYVRALIMTTCGQYFKNFPRSLQAVINVIFLFSMSSHTIRLPSLLFLLLLSLKKPATSLDLHAKQLNDAAFLCKG